MAVTILSPRKPGQQTPYLAITDMLAQMGVHAPRVLARNAEQGFLLVTDLGSITYLAELADPVRADPLYGDALDALLRIQRHGDPHAERLPPYDGSCCGSR